MRAIGQITITNICDVVASDTPPENPYIGQLWVDTSVNPPETKVWNGDSWEVQNDLDTIRVAISVLTTRSAELQSTIDGLNSYVGTISKKGVVKDCADRVMGIAKDVDRRIVAVWFFSDMLKR